MTSALARRVRLLVVLLASLALAPPAARVWAAPLVPNATDRQVAIAVAVLAEHYHLTGHPLDDEISQRCLKAFLNALDPAKLYFYQSDVETFLKNQDNLDDLVRQGDMSFACDVLTTFLRRVDQRTKLIDELLRAPHDFSVDEQLVADPEQTRYAKDEAEARERWRKLVKYDLLVQKADGIEPQEAVDELMRKYHNRAKRFHQVDREELLETYLSCLTSAFDPHSNYMSPGSYEDLKISLRLGLEGIGALLGYADGYAEVHAIVPGGAADRDGRLRVGDKIVGVGQGEEGKLVDVVAMPLRKIVNQIRGQPGTVVRLEVISTEDRQRKVVDITRAKVDLKDQEARGEILEVGAERDGKPCRVGVIDLPSFYLDMDALGRGEPDFKSATRDVRRILERFNTEGVDAVVLDLRDNPGGSLPEAVSLTGMFLAEGPVVQVKDSSGRVEPQNDPDPEEIWKGPLVVVTSRSSASASEILAGAIQDYHRGLIVGDPATHGKGTVQVLLDVAEQLHGPRSATKLGALKITTQQFYRPSGASTQNRGVPADVELPSITSHLEIGEAQLDFALPFDQVEPARFRPYRWIDKATCDQLVEMSKQRRRESKDFQEVLREVARYEDRKARKHVPLNEQEFLDQYAEFHRKDDESLADKPDASRDSGIRRDYYLEEVLRITVDYAHLAGKPTQQADSAADVG